MNRRTFLKYAGGLAGTAVIGANVTAAEPTVVATSAALRDPIAIAPSAAFQDLIVQKVQPTKKRRWIMGFGPAIIPAGEIVVIQSQPRCLFRGEKVFNTGDIRDLEFLNIFVGKKSQIPGWNEVISFDDAFAHKKLFSHDFDTCDPALFIAFQVRNRGAEARMACLSMVGHL